MLYSRIQRFRAAERVRSSLDSSLLPQRLFWCLFPGVRDLAIVVSAELRDRPGTRRRDLHNCLSQSPEGCLRRATLRKSLFGRAGIGLSRLVQFLRTWSSRGAF